MQPPAPPLKRVMDFGDHGQDIKVAQRALHRALGAHARNKKNGRYGVGTVADVIRFQRREGITPARGGIGPKTWKRLWHWVNAPDARIYHNWHVPPVKTPTELNQAEITRAAYWFIAHARTIRYLQTRPIPYWKMDVWNPAILTDCSGSVSMCYYSAGSPDPNGQGYNGLGWTGTLRSNGRWVRPPYQVGDMVHYGSGVGKHVAMVLSYEDDLNFSFGSNPPRLVRRNYRSDFAGVTRHRLV